MKLSITSIRAIRNGIQYELNFRRNFPGCMDDSCGLAIAFMLADLGGLGGAW